MLAELRRLTLLLLLPFLAATAAQGTQVPGYYRYMVGSFEVTALYDGNLRISPQILHGVSSQEARRLLAQSFADTTEKGVQTAINAFLVKTGEHLILVDTGDLGCGSASVGYVTDNLKAAGVRPEEVDVILLTHMHGDHVCGLQADGKRLYPKATVYAAETEAAFFLAPPVAGDPNEPRKTAARRSLAPYQAAGAFKTFKPGAKLFAGVNALDTHGHTPGHSSYLFESGGQNFVVLGDIMHMHAVQFAHPEVTIDYDSDQPTAKAARTALFDKLAKNGWSFAGMHLPFPGIGHLRREGQGYVYVPAEYAPLP